MFKFLIEILVAFLTTLIGIVAYFLWIFTFSAIPQVEIEENEIIAQQFTSIKVNACQVLNIPESYNGRLVTIDATAFVTYDKIRLFPNKVCKEIINDFKLVIPVLYLGNFSGTNNNLKSLLEKTDVNPNQEVDIRVIGIVKKYHDKRGELQYLIIPKSIELISPVREFEVKAVA